MISHEASIQWYNLWLLWWYTFQLLFTPSSLTLAIGPAPRTRAGALTAEDDSMEIELPLADCPQNLDIYVECINITEWKNKELLGIIQKEITPQTAVQFRWG